MPSELISQEQIQEALPPNLKGAVTPELVDKLNTVISDPVAAQQVKDNFLSYTRVLQGGKYKLDDYLSAVMFVSYRLMNLSNREAYKRTFPDRHAALMAKNLSEKDYASHVSSYSRGKLVNAILEQSLVPSWVLNQDLYQQALNAQADLMMNANSEMVRTQAANSILTHLARPKETAPLINVDMRESSGMNELKDMLSSLAQKQLNLVKSGIPAKTLAALDLNLENLDDDGTIEVPTSK